MKQWHEKLDINKFYDTLNQFYGRKKNVNTDSDFFEFLKEQQYSLHEVDVILEKIVSDTERKKKTASFYTPRDIVDIFDINIIENTEVKILEPAVGAGQLLISFLKNCDLKYKIRIVCYDISKDALLCTEFRLFLNGYEIPNISVDYINENFLNSNINERFDLILSNPPYIEVRKHEIDKKFCYAQGNLYALFMEKCSTLLNENAEMHFIIPYSFVATTRMSNLRNHLESVFSRVEYRNFADRPSSLFPKVHQKITLFSGKTNYKEEFGVFFSDYIHFYKDERKKKLDNITLYKNEISVFRCSNEIEKNIVNKVTSYEFIKNSNDYTFDIYINPRSTFWMKIFLTEQSNTYKKYSFKTKNESIYAYAFLNSSLYYLLWTISGDGWHVTNKDLMKIYYGSSINMKKLEELSFDLSSDLEEKKEYIGSKQVEFAYKHKNSKYIIDKIDIMLCKCFGLTARETEYILNYNLRYRIGSE